MLDIKKLKNILMISLIAVTLSICVLLAPYLGLFSGWSEIESSNNKIRCRAGSVDFAVLIISDDSLSSSYTRDLTLFFLRNNANIALLNTADVSVETVENALSSIQEKLSVPSARTLLVGCGKAGERLAVSLPSLTSPVMGSVLAQVSSNSDALLEKGLLNENNISPRTLIIGDTDYADKMTGLYNLLASDNIKTTGGTYKAERESISLVVSPTVAMSGAVFSGHFFTELGNWLGLRLGVSCSAIPFLTLRTASWIALGVTLIIALASAYLISSFTMLNGSYSVVSTAINHPGRFIAFRVVFGLISSLAAAVLAFSFLSFDLPVSTIGVAFFAYLLASSAISAALYRTGYMPGVHKMPQRLKIRGTIQGFSLALIAAAFVSLAGIALAYTGFWAATTNAFHVLYFAFIIPFSVLVFLEISAECLVVESLGMGITGGFLFVLTRYYPLVFFAAAFLPVGMFPALALAVKCLLALIAAVMTGRLIERLSSSPLFSAVLSSTIICGFLAFLTNQ